MSAVEDLIQRSLQRLGALTPFEQTLTRARDSAGTAGDPYEQIRVVRGLLRDSLDTLDATRLELTELTDSVNYLAGVLPLTADGWPPERDRMLEQFRSSPRDGVYAWLTYFYRAAAEFRLDALGRLLDEVALPPALALLESRARNAVRGLADGDLVGVQDMLRPGATLASYEIPKLDPVGRAHLQLLLARLATREQRLAEAESFLAGATLAETQTSVLACRAAIARHDGRSEDAARLLAEAQDLDRANLDVVAETIRQTPLSDDANDRLESANVAIERLSYVDDADSLVGRIIDVPPQLWIAVADRARTEGRADLVEHALERAERALRSYSYDERASAAIRERQALDARPDTQVALLLAAGNARVSAQQWTLARDDYARGLAAAGRASEPDPATVAAITRRWANIESFLINGLPLARTRDDAHTALEALTTVGVAAEAGLDESWAYLTEVDLRLNLARASDLNIRAEQSWRALLAASRAVLLQPMDAARWVSLASVTTGFLCENLAELAARRADGIAPDPAPVATAMINLGRYDEVLALLPVDNEPWRVSYRAFCLSRLGDLDGALRLLQTMPLDLSMAWAYATHLSILLIRHDLPAARTLASSFLAAAESHQAEYEILIQSAFSALVLGDRGRAEALAEVAAAAGSPLGEGSGLSLLGQARLLDDDVSTGRAILLNAIGMSRPVSVRDWNIVDLPALAVVAAEIYRVPVAPLDLAPAIDARAAELAAITDPYAELALIPALDVDDSVVEAARALARLAVDLACDVSDPAAALAKVETLGTYGAELDAVRRYLAGRAASTPSAEPAEEDTSLPPADPDLIQLLLPPSWFEAYADPVADHVLFTRYLPELRTRSTWTIPGVSVSVDAALEPGGFRITQHDRVFGGDVDPAVRYCNPEALPLLQGSDGPDQLRTVLGLVVIPVGSADQRDPLVDLLSMDAIELVAYQVALVARDGIPNGESR